MPKLKVVTRRGRNTLYIRGTVRGQGIYESTGTDRRPDAEAYAAKLEQELWTRSVYGARAVVTFATAVESYLKAEPRRASHAKTVDKLLTLFGPMRLGDVTQIQLDRAYGALLRPGASPATRLRNVLTPLRAILEHAARRGWCDRPAFEVPRQPKPRVAFLLPGQATALVQAAAPHLRPLIVFLIGTAARMSEALELDWRDVDLDGGRITFRRTKAGTERHVDLAPAVRAALAALPDRDGRVFRPAYPARRRPGQKAPQWRQGVAWRDSDRNGGGQIKTGWAAACRRAGLPGEWRGEGTGGETVRAGVPAARPAAHRGDLALCGALRLGGAAGVRRLGRPRPGAGLHASTAGELCRSGRGVARAGAGEEGEEAGMSLRFRRTLRLAPGLRVNLAKRGVSLSVGRHGLTENINRAGARTTVGAPDTGLSYSTRRRRPGGSLASGLAGLLLLALAAWLLGWL